MSIASEFKEFAMRGNVIDLAVGVVIGASFGAIVSSIVNGIIMPVVGVLTSGVDFSHMAARIGTNPTGAAPRPPRQEVLLEEIRDLIAKK